LPKRDKSDDYKVSVVIPVYNSQIFLPRTVDSILSSSMSDIELILVDDGSTDDSLSICKWYAKKYPCVSVIKQKNQRVAVARNNGILAAKGEYL
jgi:glycosyltransferase involved in cell wall biosynthesis